MAGKKRFAINVGMNWVAMATGMVVPFFLSPFIVRHLGPVGYGVWILAVSTVSYLNLLDMGLRSSIVRYVSKNSAIENVIEAQKAIGAALWVRAGISIIISLLSIALALAFPHFFRVPPDLQRAGQITVLLCALGVSVTMTSGVFGAVLSGISRFDVLSLISAGQTIARAVGVFLILRSGLGLVALAYWELAIALVSGIVTGAAALKIYPPCRIPLRRPDIATLKMIWAYSFKTFIIIIAVQIVFYTDNLVVGAFISVGAVTLYSIAGNLAMYSGQVSSAMGSTFIPMASNLEATGQGKDLQKLLLRGTQAALGLMLPIGITLLLRGKTFIGLWMGQQYSQTSGTILQILLISQFFTIANSTAGQIAYGIDKHKSAAIWSAIEAAFNLTLSIILVKTIGLYGVAWGTAISMAIIHMIFWPRFVKKELGVPVRQYLWQGWAKMTLCVLPFAILSYWMDTHWHPKSKLIFFSQVALALPLFALTVLAVFNEEALAIYRRWSASRVANISTMS